MAILACKVLMLQARADRVVIRWRPLIPFFLLPLLLVRRKVWFEINSITGLDSRYFFVRKIVSFSVWLVSYFFGVVVVSDESKRQVELISSSAKRVCVIRNGFKSSFFENFSASLDVSKGCTLVYFGRKQSYYDWDMLYSALSDLRNGGHDLTMEVFGFYEAEERDAVQCHGQFNPEELTGLLSTICNPVLVLHASDSDVAKAGSPMKLYEYAALGIPCILSSSLSDKIESLSGFVEYEAGDERSLKEALVYVTHNYSDLLVKSSVSKKYALSNYTWPSVVKSWLKKA